MGTPAEDALQPGKQLDRYELLAPVARGGMGVVWVARLAGKRGFEKLVAIKTVQASLAHDGDFQAMFLDEARLAARVTHANVAQIFDLGEEHGVLYLVLEWVDGESLSAVVKHLRAAHRSVPLGVALRILADICGGLHAAHELRAPTGELLNVVHRDVSPQNILLSAEGVGKLIDFGIAKADGRASVETLTGVVKGKVYYMSPQQALGEAIDRRADVWAVGAVLYYLLTGRVPFEADNPIVALGRITRGEPPGELPPDTPAPVKKLLAHLMAFAANARIASAADAQREIERTMVECSVATTTSDVSSFFRGAMGERHAARRREIEAMVREVTASEVVTLPESASAAPTGATSGAVSVSLSTAIELSSPTLVTLDSAVVSTTQRHVFRKRTTWMAGGVTLFVVAGVALSFLARESTPIEPVKAAAIAADASGGVASAIPPAASSTAADPTPSERSSPIGAPTELVDLDGADAGGTPRRSVGTPGAPGAAPARDRVRTKGSERPDWGF